MPANGLTFAWTPKPFITSFTPNNSCGTSGVSVVITGRNFTSATTVNFNGVPAVFVVNSSTQITAQLPNTATTGAITVTTPGGTAISAASFTVNTLPTAPKVGAIKQPTCIVPSGSADLTLPIGTWTLNQNGTSIGAVTGTTKTITGLAPGIYKYTVTSASGCISQASADVVIDPLITTKLSSSGWDKGTPTIDKNIVFNAPYSLQKDDKLEACSCEVNSSVTINEGATLKIYNGVKVGTGTLTFENNASLVQENEDPTINTGNIIYKRKSSSIRKSDYIYWSSPVAAQTLKAVSPNTVSNRFWSFNAANNSWAAENWDNTMLKGKGYIIRGPEFFPTTVPATDFIVAPFTGVPHNGQFDIAIAGPDKSNLIGNPYPSALDAVSFLQANPILGTLYFWTHATEIRETTTSSSAGLVDFVYTSDDYATYNLSGSVAATAKGNTQTGVENAANKPSGKIAAGQGFFATGITSGTAIFKNSMRVGVGSITGSNTQFFKTTQSSKSTNAFEKHRVWLNLTNEQGAFKQVLVGYITDATNGYDNAFDGPNNNGNQFVNFYSINEDKNLTIQGRALPFDENDVVPLGYSSVIQGAFSISIDDVDGLLTSETIYLEDKSSNSIHDLKKAAYTFNTEKGTFNDRFVLRYRDRTLGSADFDLKGTSVLIAKDKNELKIKSQTETINQITVFDLLGRKVFDKVAVNSNEFQTSAIKLSNQIVVVKVTLANGTVISKKVIY